MVSNDLFRMLKSASDVFKALSASEYRREELPCPIDERLEQICVTFMEASPNQRRSIPALLDEQVCTALFFFAERMAMLSVRRQSYPVLLNALIALVIIGPRTDERELLMVLSLIYRSAIKLQVEPEQLFSVAVHYASDQATKTVILSYLDRNPEDRSIAAMGYRELEGPSGLVYWFGKQPIPGGLM
jgi:hypothetical protein